MLVKFVNVAMRYRLVGREGLEIFYALYYNTPPVNVIMNTHATHQLSRRR